MLKHLCPYQGCKEIIPITQSYCDVHSKTEANRQGEYDKSIRYTKDKKYHDFYLSKEWKAMKPYIARKYKGLCLYSYYIDHKIVQADMIHHIEELKENWDKRLDEENLFPLSNSAHSKISVIYKDKVKREQMQRLLSELLDRWKEEFGNEGYR
jgi:hypothetical protein